MRKTDHEVEMIVKRYDAEIRKLGITPERILLFGSYKQGTAREGSDIDLLVISNDFFDMNVRERLELLGLAAGRVFEPIEAWGYTPEEVEQRVDPFIEEILESVAAGPAEARGDM